MTLLEELFLYAFKKNIDWDSNDDQLSLSALLYLIDDRFDALSLSFYYDKDLFVCKSESFYEIASFNKKEKAKVMHQAHKILNVCKQIKGNLKQNVQQIAKYGFYNKYVLDEKTREFSIDYEVCQQADRLYNQYKELTSNQEEYHKQKN